MDQCLWQTIISFDLLHSLYMWLSTILSWGKHCQTMQIGTVSRFRFCGRSRMQNLHKGEHCAFLEVIQLFQSVGCVRNKLQFRTVRQNQKSFPWMQDEEWMAYAQFIYGIWSSQFFTETRVRVIKNGETCVRTYVRFVQHLTNFKNEKSHGMIDDLDHVDFISSNVNSSRQEALLYVFEDNEAVIKMIIKGRSPTMRHVSQTQSCSWLVVR